MQSTALKELKQKHPRPRPILAAAAAVLLLLGFFSGCAGTGGVKTPETKGQDADSREAASGTRVDGQQASPEGKDSDSSIGQVSPADGAVVPFRAALKKALPPGWMPVLERGMEMSLRADLDADGDEDAVFLLIPSEFEELRRFLVFSDYSRVGSEDEKRVPVRLFPMYRRDDGGVHPASLIDAGSGKVLERYALRRLAGEGEYPVVVDLEFSSSKGSRLFWLVYPGTGGPATFGLELSNTAHYTIRDIDADGLQDLIVFRRIFEEDVGFETYLMWYGYADERMSERSTVNIVRSLNNFLDTCREILVRQGTRGFLSYAAEEAAEDLPLEEAVVRVFAPIPEESEADTQWICSDLSDVIDVLFPRILENPFPERFGPGAVSTFQVRLVCKDGQSRLRQIAIKLDDNPFEGRQYFLLLQKTTD
ncbi:MAG: hypothetical protein K9L68_03960 [Spirochaetales bacterium]|nr:hypothetical protein [Spirochaetales bacterium]MCF7937734.1 hypothetical protein [Spirochaetales bacterium]